MCLMRAGYSVERTVRLEQTGLVKAGLVLMTGVPKVRVPPCIAGD